MNLHEEFTKRCLFKSLDFLNSVGYKSPDFSLNSQESFILTCFFNRDYHSLTQLPPDDNRVIFLKFYAEILAGKIKSQGVSSETRKEISKLDNNNAYFSYLKALTCENNALGNTLNALKLNNYFFEAFEQLVRLSELPDFSRIEVELSSIIQDPLLRSIYFLKIFIHKLLKSRNLTQCAEYVETFIQAERNTVIPFSTENPICNPIPQMDCKFSSRNPNSCDGHVSDRASMPNIRPVGNGIQNHRYLSNLLAAYHYCCKNYSESLRLFEENLQSQNICIKFMDMYSHILYMDENIQKAALLAQKLTLTHPFSPETMVCVANYYSLRKDHIRAIEYLDKSIFLDENASSNYTLLGNEFTDLKKYDSAIEAYFCALKFNKSDYRAYYGIGCVKKSLLLEKEAVFYFKRALEIHSADPYLWIEYGSVLEVSGCEDEAISAYKRAYQQGDIDGLLKAGDLFKKKSEFPTAIQYYELYVEGCRKIGRECSKVVECIEKFNDIIQKTNE